MLSSLWRASGIMDMNGLSSMCTFCWLRIKCAHKSGGYISDSVWHCTREVHFTFCTWQYNFYMFLSSEKKINLITPYQQFSRNRLMVCDKNKERLLSYSYLWIKNSICSPSVCCVLVQSIVRSSRVVHINITRNYSYQYQYQASPHFGVFPLNSTQSSDPDQKRHTSGYLRSKLVSI